MDGYPIAEAARRSGFSASALRYYEQHGLLHPRRTDAGYRCYDERDLERLAFLSRAKGLGCTLPEIEELLGLLDDERCSPVQERLRDLIDERIAEADARSADLAAFAAELRRVAGTLDRPAADGPCDDDCGCLGEVHAPAPVPVGLGRRSSVADDDPATVSR